MLREIPKFWFSLLLLAFAYGASCSALHYGQAGQGNHAQHLASLAGAAEASHHQGHAAPTPAPLPASADLECCALIALSAKNLAQLQTTPEDLVPWIGAVVAGLLTALLVPLSLPLGLPFRQSLAIHLPQTLLQRKTCLLC